MTTLISLLGKNRADPQTGYRKANYSFEPDFSRTVSFFGLALLDYAKPDRLILAGTAGSMWDVFFAGEADNELPHTIYAVTILYTPRRMIR